MSKICNKTLNLLGTGVLFICAIEERAFTEAVSVYELSWRLRRFKLSSRHPV